MELFPPPFPPPFFSALLWTFSFPFSADIFERGISLLAGGKCPTYYSVVQWTSTTVSSTVEHRYTSLKLHSAMYHSYAQTMFSANSYTAMRKPCSVQTLTQLCTNHVQCKLLHSYAQTMLRINSDMCAAMHKPC